MQQNHHSLKEDSSIPFTSNASDNIAIVAAIKNMDAEEVEAICIENIMANIMYQYNTFLEKYYPELVQEVRSILQTLHLDCTVGDFIFDSVAAQREKSEYWEVFKHLKRFVQPYTAL